MGNNNSDQAVAQCRAIIHMASVLADIYRRHATMLDSNSDINPLLFETIGNSSRRMMNSMADILNGIDAVTEEDMKRWGLVFARSQEVFPARTPDAGDTD